MAFLSNMFLKFPVTNQTMFLDCLYHDKTTQATLIWLENFRHSPKREVWPQAQAAGPQSKFSTSALLAGLNQSFQGLEGLGEQTLL